MAFNIADSEEFNELSFYSMSHPDRDYFIHQHVVDAYQAQMADEDVKEIAIIFALLGLYLFLEENFTGREVQLMHMKIAKNKPNIWPKVLLPDQKAAIQIQDVLNMKSEAEKDAMIRKWCESVWQSFSESQQVIRDFTQSYINS